MLNKPQLESLQKSELLEKKLLSDLNLLRDLHRIEARLQDRLMADLKLYRCQGCLNQHKCWNNYFESATIVNGNCLNRK
jgi:hypothetical protein